MSEITQAKIHDAAMIAHEANRAYCLTIGDSSHLDWRSTPENIRASVISGAEAIAKDPSITPEESHEKWSAYKTAEGWIYGPVKDLAAKTHPCLVPYAELPENDRQKDRLFGAVVRVVLGLPLGPSLGAVPALDYQLLADDYARLVEDLQQLRAATTFHLAAGTVIKPAAGETLSISVPVAIEPTDSEGAET